MTGKLDAALGRLAAELTNGTPQAGGFVLNKSDPGLFASLDKLSADAASARHDDAPSVASHVAHLRDSLSIMNRWAAGEDPWSSANWADPWKKTQVSDADWLQLRSELRREAETWQQNMRSGRELNEVELTGTISSIVHLAYHLGAIRQIDRSIRGPSASGSL